MKPKGYQGKGEGKKPFPFFDSNSLMKQDDSCHIMVMSDSTVRIIHYLSSFLKWPTRWDDSNQESDIDEIIRRFELEMIPCDNILSGLEQSIKDLASSIESMKEGGNMSGCGCNCGCSDGGDGGVFDPTTYPNVPEYPSEIQTTVTDVDCKFAHYAIDRVLAMLDALSTRVGWGVVGLTAFAIASVMAGQIEITGALVSFMWAMFTQGMLTAAGIASVYNFLSSRREDFVCQVSQMSNSSPASFKQACIAWLHSQGDDNTPAITILIGIFTLSRFYNNMLQEDWKVGYEDVSCCGEVPDAPGTYYLVPCSYIATGDILDLEGNVITSVTLVKSGNHAHINGTLQKGKGFKVPLAGVVVGGDNVVGWCVRCVWLIKSITQQPTATFVRDTPSTVTDFGLIRLNEGFCGMSVDESGEDYTNFVSYLESIGIDVFQTLESDAMALINSNGYFSCSSYEKESIGGTGGNVDIKLDLYYVKKVV